jgi:hypothetical protein
MWPVGASAPPPTPPKPPTNPPHPNNVDLHGGPWGDYGLRCVAPAHLPSVADAGVHLKKRKKYKERAMFIFMLDLGGIMGFGAWHPLTSLRSLMRASIYRKGKNTKNRARNGPAGAPGAAPMPGLKTFTPSGETPSGSHGGASPSPIPPPHTSPFW